MLLYMYGEDESGGGEDSRNWCLLHLGKWSHRWSNWSQPDTSHRKTKENPKFCLKIADSFFSVAHNQMVNHTPVLLLIVFNINQRSKQE